MVNALLTNADDIRRVVKHCCLQAVVKMWYLNRDLLAGLDNTIWCFEKDRGPVANTRKLLRSQVLHAYQVLAGAGVTQPTRNI